MERKIVYQDDNFRKHEPETVSHNGYTYRIQACADFIGGRWEYFMSFPSRADMLNCRKAHGG
jgi:hypothetical protein